MDDVVREGITDMGDEEVWLEDQRSRLQGGDLVSLANEAVAAAQGSRPSSALLGEVLSRVGRAEALNPLSQGHADHGETLPVLAAVEERGGGESGYEADAGRWRKQVTAELTGMKLGSHTEASETFGRLLALFEAARDESAALDQQAIKEDRKLQQDPLYHFKSPMPTVALVSISEYYDLLNTILVALFEGINRAYQVMLEAVIGDLEAGRGPASLEPLKDALTKMKSAVLTPGKSKGGLLVEVTRSLFAGRGNMHLDYYLQRLVVPDDVFVRDKDQWFEPWPPPPEPEKKHSVAIDFYDVDQKTGNEKKLSLEVVYVRRAWQVGLLDRLYGENATIISRLSGKTLRLHSNDDWREFLMLKLGALKEQKVPDEDALTATVEFLQEYLQAFTIHTPYNIYDNGRSKDNYLTREFPRALTGQVIHDCGVYALRIAYILSLVRKELKLQFHFLLLPDHMGVVITSEKLPTPLITHNGTIHRLDEEELAELRKAWQGFAHPPGRADETQFLGELGCALFITGPLSMPFQFVSVPQYESKIKERLWSFYQTDTAHELFGSAVKKRGSGVFQFDLEYLKLLQEDVLLHNERVVPFWNVDAPTTWTETEQFLESLRADVGTGQPVRAQTIRVALLAYRSSLEHQFDRQVGERLAQLKEAKEQLHDKFESYPNLKRKTIRSSYGPRVKIFDYSWHYEYRKHLRKVEEKRASLSTSDQVNEETFKLIQEIRPPFADKSHRLYILLPIDY